MPLRTRYSRTFSFSGKPAWSDAKAIGFFSGNGILTEQNDIWGDENSPQAF